MASPAEALPHHRRAEEDEQDRPQRPEAHRDNLERLQQQPGPRKDEQQRRKRTASASCLPQLDRADCDERRRPVPQGGPRVSESQAVEGEKNSERDDQQPHEELRRRPYGSLRSNVHVQRSPMRAPSSRGSWIARQTIPTPAPTTSS